MKMVRLSLLTGAGLLALATAASAADLPQRTPPPYVAVPVFTWTGFYVGVNAGYGFADEGSDTLFGASGLNVVTTAGLVPVTSPTAGFVGAGDRSRSGFVGGGQVGYNWQVTPGAGWVIGIEGDVQYADLSRNKNNNFAAFGGNGLFLANPVAPTAVGSGIAVPTALSANTNIALFNNTGGFGNGCGEVGAFGGFGSNGVCGSDWFATVRGRLGYAWDRVFVYATGGVAFTDSGSRNNGFAVGFAGSGAIPAAFFVSPGAIAAAGTVIPAAAFVNNNNSNDVGYAVGGGVEYAFSNNWTAKLEGLYVNFGHGKNAFPAASIVGVSNTGAPITAAALGLASGNRDNDFGVIRVGLNYKFGTW